MFWAPVLLALEPNPKSADYYERLGVYRSDSRSEILMKAEAVISLYKRHVDRGAKNEWLFEFIEAYEDLADPEEQRVHDRQLGIEREDSYYQTATDWESRIQKFKEGLGEIQTQQRLDPTTIDLSDFVVGRSVIADRVEDRPYRSSSRRMISEAWRKISKKKTEILKDGEEYNAYQQSRFIAATENGHPPPFLTVFTDRVVRHARWRMFGFKQDNLSEAMAFFHASLLGARESRFDESEDHSKQTLRKILNALLLFDLWNAYLGAYMEGSKKIPKPKDDEKRYLNEPEEYLSYRNYYSAYMPKSRIAVMLGERSEEFAIGLLFRSLQFKTGNSFEWMRRNPEYWLSILTTIETFFGELNESKKAFSDEIEILNRIKKELTGTARKSYRLQDCRANLHQVGFMIKSLLVSR